MPGTMKCSSRESPTEADLTASPPRWVTDIVTVGDSTRPSSTRAGWISPFTSRSRPLLQEGGGGVMASQMSIIKGSQTFGIGMSPVGLKLSTRALSA
jgi:hypothetical protein